MKLIMPGWKKVKHDAHNTVYERRVGNALLRAWFHSEPYSCRDAWEPEYRWTIERDKDDFTMTSKGTFESIEEAAQFAEVKLKELK